MPYFRIKQRDFDQMWVPDHAEIEWLAAHPHREEETHEQRREALHTPVNDLYPGAYSLTWSLPELKADRLAEINARTAALIAGGFVYQGVRYSASEQAQLLYLNCRTLIPPSITVNHYDDAGDTTFTNLTVGSFVNAALGFVRSTLDSGTLLKRQIRNATTVEAVQAVADNR